jgi:alpha-glucuronidase
MGSDYYEPCWQTSHLAEGNRDRAWLTKATVTGAGEPTPGVAWKPVPDAAIRMVNHWDNFDGTVERGYSGRSIFFEDGRFREDWQLIDEYAELLASVRINAISINNVNVREGARWLITNTFGHLDKLKVVNDIFAKHGIKTFIAINFSAPRVVGGLKTSDPLDERVVQFWTERVAEIYAAIPGFGGFVVKADAEGEPGPLQYGRSHGDGANMFGRILAPYGGLVFWRCFVYNHEQDWRDRRTDRAKAAYDNFQHLDGTFADNVILQIKNGPIDFQVKEPVSPLFGALAKTNQVCEFQITQEYLGQQQHICYLAPLWKEVLDFRPGGNKGTGAPFGAATVAESLRLGSPDGHYGFAAVSNVGLDANWTGHKFAQANLYAYGRLCWDASLTPEQIAAEWVELSFIDETPGAKDLIRDVLLTSRDTYRLYTVPLGIGFMCRPGHHYGVDVDGYEYDRWGTYHFADRDGIGVDRTAATGSGFTGQFFPETAAGYESLETCPDEDLLFFHHVPYTHVLHSGKTVIQHIYDSHFEGALRAAKYLADWEEAAGQINPIDHKNVRDRLFEQVASANQWRDVVNTYFLRHSGIADERAGELNREIYP